jgi:phosphate transport system ATP-binding protein
VDPLMPPPIKRIVVDREPRVVDPPPPGSGGNGTAAPGVLAHSPTLRRRHSSAVAAVERMAMRELSIAYGEKVAVNSVSLPVRQGEVLALIGPSGCGKTTLLRSLNRLTELTPTARRWGQITLDGEDVDRVEVTHLRRRVSMVFQQPNPFPMSVFDNVAYALREQDARKPKRPALTPAVQDALERAGLHSEVADDLDRQALRLSGGQQQRLCIARSLAANPDVLLLDEPCSALDPISTEVIEQLIVRLREQVAIVIVTHNLQQAYRVADHVAFMYLGDLVEYGPVEQIFHRPVAKRTKDYVGGAFG